MLESLKSTLRPAIEAAMLLAFRKGGVRRTVNGTPLRVHPRSRATFTSRYDPEAVEYLRSHLAPGHEVWNVGANVGVYVLQLASWLGPTGRIVAFEPNRDAAELLRANVRLNGFDARVEIVEVAVGEVPGSTPFFSSGPDGMARAGRPNPLLQRATGRDVPMTTLDSFAATRGRVPDWVVMDIEGWEIAALRGARRLLSTARFVVELHPSAWAWSGHSRQDLEALIAEHQLDVVPLSTRGDPLASHGQALLLPRRTGRVLLSHRDEAHDREEDGLRG